jgi:hypothetical protein
MSGCFRLSKAATTVSGLAGLRCAVTSLAGLVAGTGRNGRREHRRWLRDQQLRAAVAVIGASSGHLPDQGWMFHS